MMVCLIVAKAGYFLISFCNRIEKFHTGKENTGEKTKKNINLAREHVVIWFPKSIIGSREFGISENSFEHSQQLQERSVRSDCLGEKFVLYASHFTKLKHIWDSVTLKT